jgi:uncharacterized protein (TIGR03086 family)
VDEVATMRRVIEVAGGVVDAIEPEQLGDPSPCRAWAVRDVVNHVVAGADVFACCVRDGAISDADLSTIVVTDALGDDFARSFHRATGAVLDAFAQPGAMDRLIAVPIGEMPGRMAAEIAIFEVTTHAWDLAKATGQSTDLDPEVAATAYRIARTMVSDAQRATGRFGPMVEVADDAPMADRLAAFTGRTP